MAEMSAMGRVSISSKAGESKALPGTTAGLRYLRSADAGADEVRIEPRLGGLPIGASGGAGLVGAVFSVQPALPEGLSMDPTTGIVSGTLPRGTPGQAAAAYRVTVSFSTELRMQAFDPSSYSGTGRASLGRADSDGQGGLLINEDFAERLEHVVDVADLLPEPARTRAYGDWMVWMVHRVFLDDPSLIELDFTSMHMPLGHIEKRIAPKLMAAIETNTHLEVLTLSNSNMQKVQALELASSLLKNKTLLELNLEGNFLDSNAVRELAVAIKNNPECRIEHFRVSHQKQMGQFFGRPTEEAIGQMMDTNETIVKLGFECDDAHWRNLIDRALVRNNDYWRRRHQGPGPEEAPAGEERTLGKVTLQEAPATKVAEVFPREATPHETYRVYVVQNGRLPTCSQLQSCARNSGAPLSYAVAGPLIKECRSRLLDAAESKEVVITDAFGTDVKGTLKGWCEANEQWSFEIASSEGKRLIFRAAKEPGFAVSPAWVAWLSGAPPARHAPRAGA